MFKDDVIATDIVYFHFAVNATTGAADDGATPLYDVRLCGGAAGDAPVASGTPTLLTHANYSPGLYEIAIDTTGYADGEYAVFITVTVSTVGPAGHVGNFRVRTANRIDALGTELAKVPKTDGSLEFNSTCVGNIKSGLSTQTELDKVPKSDGAVTWNNTALASIQGEAEDALGVYDGPTNTEASGYATAILAKLLAYFQIALRGDADVGVQLAADVAALNANLGGGAVGTYLNPSHSQQAIRARGDVAWITATGFNTTVPPTVGAIADEVQTRTIARVTLVDTTTVNSDMRGTNAALLAANYTAPDNATIGAIDGRIPAALTANGNMKSSLVEILTTALTETAGLLAGGFKKFFNVAAPTGTLNSLPAGVPDGAGGIPISDAGGLDMDALATELAKVPKSDSNVTFNATALASIKAQAVAALATDTYAEPGQGNPPATTTLANKIGYNYKWTLNKKDNDGTTTQFYNNAGTVVDQKQPTSEAAGTVTKGKIVTGP